MKKKEVRYYLMIGIIALLVCLGLTSLTNQIGNVDSDVFQYVAGKCLISGCAFVSELYGVFNLV